MILNPRTYTIRRHARSVVEGVVEETLVDEFEVVGNLQPMNDRELANFAEGLRTRGAWKLYTEGGVDLRIGGESVDKLENHEPDRLVTDDGTLLYVHGVEDFDRGLIPHRKWILVEPETEVGRAAS